MIVRVTAAPRAAGLSCEEFQAHWSGEHGRLAGQIPGVRAYVQNHAVLADGRPLLPYIGFDAFAEISFDSVQAMDDGFASDFYRSSVVSDEGAMIDKRHFYLILASRRALDDRAVPETAVKLITFLPLEARAEPEALQDVLAGDYVRALEGAPILHHEQLLRLPDAKTGSRLPLPYCEAVDLVWFADMATALAFTTSEPADRARRTLSGLAFGAERLIARPVIQI
jgi:uncharacterized protein (TIGR02118 family)